MKILIVSSNAKSLGGASAAARAYARILRLEGYDTVELDMEDLERLLIKKRRAVYFFIKKFLAPVFYIYNPYVFFLLKRLCYEEKITHCFLHLYIGGLSNAAVHALRRSRVRVFHVVHDYRQICPANAMLDRNKEICEACKNGTSAVLTKNCKNNLFLSAFVYIEAKFREAFFSSSSQIDRMVFVSNFAKIKHQEFLGHNGGDVVVYNSIEAGVSKKRVTEVFSSQQDFCYVGRLSSEKGIDRLCEAFLRSSCNLDIYGAGPLEDRVAELCAGAANLNFKGILKSENVVKTIARYKFMVLPSQWYENNPISVIEALSTGTPVVVTRKGGLPEMTADECLFLPDHNEWRSYLEALTRMDLQAYADMCKRARSLFENKFSDKQFVRGVKAILSHEVAS